MNITKKNEKLITKLLELEELITHNKMKVKKLTIKYKTQNIKNIKMKFDAIDMLLRNVFHRLVCLKQSGLLGFFLKKDYNLYFN